MFILRIRLIILDNSTPKCISQKRLSRRRYSTTDNVEVICSRLKQKPIEYTSNLIEIIIRVERKASITHCFPNYRTVYNSRPFTPGSVLIARPTLSTPEKTFYRIFLNVDSFRVPVPHDKSKINFTRGDRRVIHFVEVRQYK